jgi:hypothetical protein
MQWVLTAISLVLKWPGCEADYSPLSSAVGDIPALPIYFHGVVLNQLSTGTTLPLSFNEYD